MVFCLIMALGIRVVDQDRIDEWPAEVANVFFLTMERLSEQATIFLRLSSPQKPQFDLRLCGCSPRMLAILPPRALARRARGQAVCLAKSWYVSEGSQSEMAQGLERS